MRRGNNELPKSGKWANLGSNPESGSIAHSQVLWTWEQVPVCSREIGTQDSLPTSPTSPPASPGRQAISQSQALDRGTAPSTNRKLGSRPASRRAELGPGPRKWLWPGPLRGWGWGGIPKGCSGAGPGLPRWPRNWQAFVPTECFAVITVSCL